MTDDTGTTGTTAIRVHLPTHLRKLAHLDGELTLDVPGAVTIGAALDALETRYPVLKGTIRQHGGGKRRAFVRFFACEQDLSHEPQDTPLPEPVIRGTEPLMVIGAMAGG
ncbi:hypothetical protein BJF85_18810 [Saccharomonospora sp. CUA-673]|uniref:MoaD/ThiS family protein n=1 Tax=Saccharomonospora sp. CUA-673 TaxID=1904969 RepID=UPI000968677B|nr:MoaD/ThiS family protein [Saccharomonospora sp. CUA-673]OLT45429.1 hypothetical protein BJF85_18810 [Saccharomonospora sp. CUA-673]